MKMDKFYCVISVFRHKVDEKRAAHEFCCVCLDELLKWAKGVIILNWPNL